MGSIYYYNPFATGNTPVCGRRCIHVKHITMYEVPKNTFLHYFLIILKRTLQNYQKIMKKCFFVINKNKKNLFSVTTNTSTM